MGKSGTALLFLIIGLIVGSVATYYYARCKTTSVGIQLVGPNKSSDGGIQITQTGPKQQSSD